VVDDDQDIRESLAQILTEEGFEVSSASNGMEALEEIDRRRPDVMLLDLMMPVLTGWRSWSGCAFRGRIRS
jgi:DNA-binding response OmpR family regulator